MQIKLRILRWRHYSELSGWIPHNWKYPYKREVMGRFYTDRRVKDIEIMDADWSRADTAKKCLQPSEAGRSKEFILP